MDRRSAAARWRETSKITESSAATTRLTTAVDTSGHRLRTLREIAVHGHVDQAVESAHGIDRLALLFGRIPRAARFRFQEDD